MAALNPRRFVGVEWVGFPI